MQVRMQIKNTNRSYHTERTNGLYPCSNIQKKASLKCVGIRAIALQETIRDQTKHRSIFLRMDFLDKPPFLLCQRYPFQRASLAHKLQSFRLLHVHKIKVICIHHHPTPPHTLPD